MRYYFQYYFRRNSQFHSRRLNQGHSYLRDIPDSLYLQSINALNKEGFIIQKTTKDLYQLSAKYAMAEEGTDINVNIIVRSELNGSSAVITGIWFVGQARQQKAAWIEERYQLWKYSFALMVKVAQQMNGTIKYAK